MSTDRQNTSSFSQPRATVAAKNAYEIRLETLRLAFEVQSAPGGTCNPTVDQILETAKKFNEFISKN